MECPACWSERPYGDVFCGRCGTRLSATQVIPPQAEAAQPVAPEWEYRELTLPLQFKSNQQLNEAQHGERLLDAHLQRLKVDGWEPDMPTSWAYLMKHGLVIRTFQRSRFGGNYYVYQSATLRMRRRPRVSPDASVS